MPRDENETSGSNSKGMGQLPNTKTSVSYRKSLGAYPDGEGRYSCVNLDGFGSLYIADAADSDGSRVWIDILTEDPTFEQTLVVNTDAYLTLCLGIAALMSVQPLKHESTTVEYSDGTYMMFHSAPDSTYEEEEAEDGEDDGDNE